MVSHTCNSDISFSSAQACSRAYTTLFLDLLAVVDNEPLIVGAIYRITAVELNGYYSGKLQSMIVEVLVLSNCSEKPC